VGGGVSGFNLVVWAFAGVSLLGTFYAARAAYRRNPVGAAYLSALVLLWWLASLTGIMAREPGSPFWFLAYLILAVLFGMLVSWRVRETGRIIRGWLAFLVWLAGGLALHLSALVERLRSAYPLDRYPELPSWAFGVCVGTIMVGTLIACLQLREAETYFT
jgi:hypothetical protein